MLSLPPSLLAKFRDSPPIAAAAGAVVAAAICLAIATLVMWIVGFDAAPVVYLFAGGVPMVIAPLAIYPLVRTRIGLRRMQAELDRLARTDALTSLPNRRAFFERAEQMLARPEAAASPLTAIMIDVDHFRAINDHLGHDAGDAALRRLGAAIRDTVALAEARDWIVARLGGEEFAVLAEGLVASAVGRLAERICQNARRAVEAKGAPRIATTVSVGVAFRAERMDIDALLKTADAAVQVAKRSGRDRWSFAIRDNAPDARIPVSRRSAVEFIRPALR